MKTHGHIRAPEQQVQQLLVAVQGPDLITSTILTPKVREDTRKSFQVGALPEEADEVPNHQGISMQSLLV